MKNYTRVFFILMLAASSHGLNSCKGSKMDNPEEKFGIASYYELVHEGNLSNHQEKEIVVVNSQQKMQELYAQINSTRRPGLKMPDVNFKKEFLVFAYAGERNTGGYSIEIVKVEDHQDYKQFDFKINQPDGMATMAFTSPFMIIKVVHDDKKIRASFN